MKSIVVSVFIILASLNLMYAQGTLRGKITDQSGEALIGVTLIQKSNYKNGTTTDFDGNFSIKFPDDSLYTVLISYIGYNPLEEKIKLGKNEVLVKNFILTTSAKDIKEVQISAKVLKAKEYYFESIKKNSSTTIDYISSETMKKTGDANVVAAISRVSGVSTNGAFITVRGIGDRYVKTTINGLRIPTLDPFTNNIKLDMFPSSLVDNIVITKTASPDLPGDWAGAYISVETKDYPDALSVNMETSFGYNNQTSFKEVLGTQRSSTEWLGYENNFRDRSHSGFVPVTIDPTSYEEFSALGLQNYYNSIGVTKNTPWNDTYTKLGLVELGLLDKALFDDAEAVKNAKQNFDTGDYQSKAFNVINADAAKSGQSFSNNWALLKRRAPLSFSQSFSIGNQTNVFGKPLGFFFGLRYGSSIQYDPNSRENRASLDANGLDGVSSRSTQQYSKETNGWSVLANLAYKLNQNNSITFLFMPTLTGTNSVRDLSDDAENDYLLFTKSQLYEQKRQLFYALKTEHYIPSKKVKIDFDAAYTKGKSDAPDFKNLRFIQQKSDSSYQIGGSFGIDRYYRYLNENIFDSRVSAEFPLGNKPELSRKIKIGAAYQNTDRTFDQYRYFMKFGPAASLILPDDNIEQFFNLDYFGIVTKDINGVPTSTIEKYYEQDVNPANHTIGTAEIQAVYAATDYAINPRIRISGGLRIEKAYFFTDVYKYDSLGFKENDQRRFFSGDLLLVNPGRLNETNYLPSVNFIYKVKNDETAPMNLRLNFSQTLARPSLRELSDIVTYDFEYKAVVFGNSDLKTVYINNYDIRFESYFKSGDNISLSVFHKDFKDHIELVKSTQGYSWQNVDKSNVSGIEFEFRKKITRQFTLSGNLALIYSKTEFLQTDLRIENGIKTFIPVKDVSRSMFGQAPYTVNAIASYAPDSLGLILTLSYNVQGPRLVLTSTDGPPDIYELPRNLIDFKVSKTIGKHFSVSATARDILNSPVRRSYNYADGWNLDYDKYRFGTTYLLAISYKL